MEVGGSSAATADRFGLQIWTPGAQGWSELAAVRLGGCQPRLSTTSGKFSIGLTAVMFEKKRWDMPVQTNGLSAFLSLQHSVTLWLEEAEAYVPQSDCLSVCTVGAGGHTRLGFAHVSYHTCSLLDLESTGSLVLVLWPPGSSGVILGCFCRGVAGSLVCGSTS